MLELHVLCGTLFQIQEFVTVQIFQRSDEIFVLSQFCLFEEMCVSLLDFKNI